jgi:RING finger protein 113A
MEEPQNVPELPTAMFKKRATKSKATARKRAVSPPPDAYSESEFTSSEDEEGRQIKRRRKNGGVAAKSTQSAARPTTDDQPAPTTATAVTLNDATKALDWFDESENKMDAKQLLGTTRARPNPSVEPDGTYKGQAGYQSFLQKNPDAPSRQVGPVKSSTNVRTITVTDFAPDVCRDYKVTGYCGFGDNCKFSHMREDYKQGWELDRDWEIGTKGKRIQGKTIASANRSAQNGGEDEDDDALLESIPFACIICKKPYKSPIVTKCGHYFCEACALQRYRKNPTCAACGTGTGGVFNVAKKLSKLLEKKKERAKKRKEKAIENGEEVSGSDEDDDG